MKVAFPASVQKGIIVPHPAYAGKAAVAFSRLKVGETVTVTVESEKKTRTLSQNARMWMLLSVFEELGWHKDEAKVWCCGWRSSSEPRAKSKRTRLCPLRAQPTIWAAFPLRPTPRT